MSNIDEKAKNNFTIEMRIFENYEKVKHEIIKVIDFLRHAETNLGMCRIFDNQNHYWREEIGFGWKNLRSIMFSFMK